MRACCARWSVVPTGNIRVEVVEETVPRNALASNLSLRTLGGQYGPGVGVRVRSEGIEGIEVSVGLRLSGWWAICRSGVIHKAASGVSLEPWRTIQGCGRFGSGRNLQ